MRLVPLVMTVLGALSMGTWARIIIPMRCSSRGFAGYFITWSVRLDITETRVIWKSRQNWVTGIESLKGYVCRLNGQMVFEIQDDSGTPPRYDLRLRCRQLRNLDWSDYIWPIILSVGGGKSLKAVNEKGQNVNFGIYFAEIVERWCVVTDLERVP
ncbi:hypothetical protein GQ602_005876 [Ophiocordyceps camponoti-floridani]|uniref:Uncharacterized protein n=1 Tax=Ophiocordyceps camponoti-floridani TaxID=2030778 RepID=A0A8H4Q1C3_9HYPO|nr:hypothetical protein GQ602_006456 [Ophiocordyceps camponoti-floridani]KAF4584503.1 hypothetical protein GQ602_005876 [Ophiocordyceps camponoti-floridani]